MVQVYERLVDEGYASARVGAGTFVAPGLPAAARPCHRCRRSRGRAVARAGCAATTRWLGVGPAALAAPREPWAADRPAFDFRPGVPDWEIFPTSAGAGRWPGAGARPRLAGPGALRRPGRLLAPAGGPGGVSHPLRGLRCTPEQVVVSGSQQALDLLARVGLDPGDAAALEEPGYPPARAVLQTAGARLVPLAVDDGGW